MLTALCSFALAGVVNAQQAKGSELEQCRALSDVPEQVHDCMDNFLDAFDANMAAYESLVTELLGGAETEAGRAFAASQTSFKAYLRDNCLWYQAFSEPSPVAAQIAQSCLVDMSRSRLQELQTLLDDTSLQSEYQGYYLFGENRNTVVFCGSSDRYWVTGEDELILRLQSAWKEFTNEGNSLLYVVLTGETDESTQALPPAGHKGVFRLSSIGAARPPRDEDCQGGEGDTADNNPVREHAEQSDSEEVQTPAEPAAAVRTEAPLPSLSAQALRAYFGAWVADCDQSASHVLCIVSTPFEDGNLSDILRPVIKLTRRAQQRTAIDVEFPGQEIASADDISWDIDSISFGSLDSARMYIADTAAIIQLRQRTLISDILLPQMIAGSELHLAVRDSRSVLTNYRATLIGLTRALEFADDFIASAAQ